jgi:hypothetical protein
MQTPNIVILNKAASDHISPAYVDAAAVERSLRT